MTYVLNKRGLRWRMVQLSWSDFLTRFTSASLTRTILAGPWHIRFPACRSRSECSWPSIWCCGPIRRSGNCCARWRILSIASANDWPRSVAPILIHSPPLYCLSPPSFRYCPRSSLYWNAPDASSIIQQREAILLAAVTTTERLHIEIERLLAIARDNVPRDIRARLRPEIEAVLQAIAAALREQAHQAATGLRTSSTISTL